MNAISKWTMALALATVPALAVITSQPVQALTTFTTLYSFCSQTHCTDGSLPWGMIQATDGSFYGITHEGGSEDAGTIFKITQSGTLTTLYSFCSQADCADGVYPTGLIQATDGTFYGTTVNGGNHGNENGVVFQITADGMFTSQGMYAGTRSPDRPLIHGSDGNFYGTSGSGGDTFQGAVYKVTPAGKVSKLYSFCLQAGCPDGSFPNGIVQATDGNFYGTTDGGGANTGSCALGCGTVYQLTPNGELTTLYSFCAQSECADGDHPFESLVQASDGNLYGTTSAGGANITSCYDGCGTVFKITPTGTFTTLYSFCSHAKCTDGSGPGSLTLGTDGHLYGETGGGGNIGGHCPYKYGCGTIFQITLGGKFTTLHRFCSKSGCPDGEGTGAMIQYTDGTFYGATGGGGSNGGGTVFSLSLGLDPFVETQTASGKVGSAVVILGTDLMGATSVTFNGTVATFTVVSASEITTTVPIGATTGYVEVRTPGGPLKSNVVYTVKP